MTGAVPPSVSHAPRILLRAYRPGRADLGELLRLAFPVALVQVGMMAMGALDTIMVGRVSPADLAAVAIGNLYFFGVAVFGMGVLFALDPVIAQAVGAGDPTAVARGVQRGGAVAVGLTVLASLLMLPAGPILSALQQPAEVVPLAAGYAIASIAGVFPFYGFVVLRQSLQAMGLVKAILWTVIAANLANFFFNWVLIYGNLGAPALGAVGSGWATSLSRWFMMLLLIAVAWTKLRPSLIPFRPKAFKVAPLVRLLRVGAPIGAQQALEFGVFGAAGLLAGLMGTVQVASHQVALQLSALTFMVPVGVAQATGILVGHAVGRADPPGARRSAGAGLLVGAGFMALTAGLFLTFPEGLASLFSRDAPVIATAALLLPIAGVFQIFDGLQVVAAGALRGVADTRVPMVLNLIGFWFVGLPVSVVLAFHFELGPRGLWWGLALGIGVVAVLLLRRIRTRFGRELRRLVIDEGHEPYLGVQGTT
ncbi:MAG: MATE family efflux transporter [Gemmatimonadetes bacterium]|nr:MATE family efflux transporter [Gemmatimonadota bacterium]